MGNRIVITILFHATIALCSGELCSRPSAGSEVSPPKELRSSGGTLETTLFFRTSLDAYSQTRYCYVSTQGAEAPTLRVKPGDTVVLHLKNEAGEATAQASPNCMAMAMRPNSTNLHFHGLSIPPLCHQDDVLHTLVAPGDPSFDYSFRVPFDQPPGLYWYHPHPHGSVEAQVLGGASGAMIVEGVERFRPEVAGLPERILILRDQLQPGQQLNYMEPGEEQEKDVSVNFVPVAAPHWTPAVINVTSGRPEFWRILNASADTYFDLQLLYGDKAQEFVLIALDGVPLSQPLSKSAILIPPGGRAEFIVRTPEMGIAASLVTRKYDTGPDGANNPARTLTRIAGVAGSSKPNPDSSAKPESTVDDLSNVVPARTRLFYLSEDRSDLDNPKYFITEKGATPKVFDMLAKEPDVTVQQGTVEDWVIENRAPESHTFHIHQLHFQVLERDGAKSSAPMILDTIDVPYWDGKGAAYPSVMLRMDFRSPSILGTFVYHCHILEHEDAGMMGSIRVEKQR